MILVAVALQLLALWLKIDASRLHLLSRDAQRLALLSDSFGREVLPFDIVDILKAADVQEEWRRAPVPEKYYSTNVDTGPKRLLINLAESIFFSRSLLKFELSRLGKENIGAYILILISSIILLAIWPNPDRYIIIVAVASIALVAIDDLESFLQINRSIKAFEKIDRRLDSILYRGTFDREFLFAAFADYCVTSATAPPIPSGLYVRKQKELNSLWYKRLEVYETEEGTDLISADRGAVLRDRRLNRDIRIYENIGSLPSWFNIYDRDSILTIIIDNLPKDSTCDAIELRRLGGASGAVTSSITLLLNGLKIAHFVVKFYRDLEVARTETDRLEEYSLLAIDFFPRHLKNPRLLGKGGVGFYHVNYASEGSFISGFEALSRAEKSRTYFQNYSVNISRCISAVAKTLTKDRISSSRAETLDIYGKHERFEPCDVVVDLRKSIWTRDTNLISILDQSPTLYPSSHQPIFREDVAPTTKHLTIPLSSWSGSKDTLAFSNLYGTKAGFIIPLDMIPETYPESGLQVRMSRVAANKLSITNELFLKNTIGGNWEKVRLSQLYRRALAILRSAEALVSTCHRDLHLGNIFISENSFRVIDFFDIGRDFAMVDICRIQISSIIRLSHSNNSHSISVIRLFLNEINKHAHEEESGKIYEMIRWIYSLKSVFESSCNRSFSEIEYIATLLFEATRQAHYSISSDRAVPSGWPELLNELQDTLAKLVDQAGLQVP
ncbi:MAG: hypothetical protein AAFR91_09725 [Pseudomonadota bacterium]